MERGMMSFGRMTAQRGAYGQLPGLGLGSFWDELPAVVSSIQIGQKDVGAECSKWQGEVVKWSTKQPDILNSRAKIASKLAEAKAEQARTCEAAATARDRADAYLAEMSTPPATGGSWLSSIDPTYWLAAGVVVIAGIVYATRRRR